jgi:hypothetical protein
VLLLPVILAKVHCCPGKFLKALLAAKCFRNAPSNSAVIPAKAGTRGEHMDVLGFEERGIHIAFRIRATWIDQHSLL